MGSARIEGQGNADVDMINDLITDEAQLIAEVNKIQTRLAPYTVEQLEAKDNYSPVHFERLDEVTLDSSNDRKMALYTEAREKVCPISQITKLRQEITGKGEAFIRFVLNVNFDLVVAKDGRPARDTAPHEQMTEGNRFSINSGQFTVGARRDVALIFVIENQSSAFRSDYQKLQFTAIRLVEAYESQENKTNPFLALDDILHFVNTVTRLTSFISRSNLIELTYILKLQYHNNILSEAKKIEYSKQFSPAIYKEGYNGILVETKADDAITDNTGNNEFPSNNLEYKNITITISTNSSLYKQGHPTPKQERRQKSRASKSAITGFILEVPSEDNDNNIKNKLLSRFDDCDDNVRAGDGLDLFEEFEEFNEIKNTNNGDKENFNTQNSPSKNAKRKQDQEFIKNLYNLNNSNGFSSPFKKRSSTKVLSPCTQSQGDKTREQLIKDIHYKIADQLNDNCDKLFSTLFTSPKSKKVTQANEGTPKKGVTQTNEGTPKKNVTQTSVETPKDKPDSIRALRFNRN